MRWGRNSGAPSTTTASLADRSALYFPPFVDGARPLKACGEAKSRIRTMHTPDGVGESGWMAAR